MTTFSWRMAWRETRAGWRHFVYFVVSIAVGVGALVTVSVFATNVERTVTREARSLLGGDLEVRLSRPLGQEGRTVLSSLGARGVTVTHVSELIAMAAVPGEGRTGPPGQSTQIIELKAVEPSYPLYGAIRVEPSQPLERLLSSKRQCSLRECPGALVQESLLIRLGLQPGDPIKIGQAVFVISGIIRQEPDRMANAFSLGPRVLISQEGLSATELVKPGSRVRERYLLRVPGGTELQPMVRELEGRLARDSARISTYRDAQPQLKRFLDQLSRYLGLVGLTALLVGGIGVATTVHAFIREKLQSIAILKTLGATTAVLVRIYALQAVMLAFLGSILGVAFGLSVQEFLPPLLRNTFATDLLEQIQFSSHMTGAGFLVVTKGIALGVLTALLFTLWPILAIREIRPSVILRRLITPAIALPSAGSAWNRPDRIRLLTASMFIVGLAALAIWQANSWRVGLLYLLGLLIAFVFLYLAAERLIVILRKVPPARSLVLRYAVSNVYRPGSQAVGIMMAIGLALMVIVSVSLLERVLVQQVTTKRPDNAPTLFFIDIQPDQREGVLELIHQYTGAVGLEALPLLRSRLASVNGQAIKAEMESESAGDRPEQRRKSWYQTREYVLTVLQDLPKDNTVIKGAWWKAGQVFTTPLVSVEEEAAQHLGIDVGSTVALDIQGTVISAQVSSIRKVEWNNFSTNFYMIFSPGSFEEAPFTYVATVHSTPAQDLPLQRAIVARFPNVTGIHIGDVLDGFTRMLDRLAVAIRAVALFSVLSGALVMATALSATRYRRLYESVILKALGATRATIARSFASEYALLGAIAGVIGIGLANVLSWGILEYLFELSWSFQPALLLTSLLLTMVLTVVTGFFSTFRILGRRPLAVLRQE